jgi:hypothetical protein
MMAKIPPEAVYCLFGIATLCATYPVWSYWVFGSAPTLDQLLQIRCF